ncbi:hypothetical protein D3C78_1652810 [compost metagenome]
MSDSTGSEISQWMLKETLAAHLEPLLKRYDVKWRGHGVIYVDHEQYNIQTLHQILAALSVDLGVPSQAIRSRLIELGWLNDVRSVLPARSRVEHVVDSLLHKTLRDTDFDGFGTDEAYD